MEKYYFAWKDRNCNGINVTWVKLDGRSFYEMISQPENKNRRFMHLGNEKYGDKEMYYFEVTEDEYSKWLKESGKERYFFREESKWTMISMEDIENIVEQIKDESIDVEGDAISAVLLERVLQGMKSLDKEDRMLLVKYYWEDKSTTRLAKEYGVSRQAISKQIQAVLYKLEELIKK